MTCPSCGWPARAGHDRDCKLVKEGGDVRHYGPSIESLPELCACTFERTDGGGIRIVDFYSAGDLGDGADTVAVGLPLLRELVVAAAGGPAGSVETRLAALEEQVRVSNGVAAQATAALERFVKAVEAERVTTNCLECRGTGKDADDPGFVCRTCVGTGRAA